MKMIIKLAKEHLNGTAEIQKAMKEDSFKESALFKGYKSFEDFDEFISKHKGAKEADKKAWNVICSACHYLRNMV